VHERLECYKCRENESNCVEFKPQRLEFD
jgi:hypothetical protein